MQSVFETLPAPSVGRMSFVCLGHLQKVLTVAMILLSMVQIGTMCFPL